MRDCTPLDLGQNFVIWKLKDQCKNGVLIYHVLYNWVESPPPLDDPLWIRPNQ